MSPALAEAKYPVTVSISADIQGHLRDQFDSFNMLKLV